MIFLFCWSCSFEWKKMRKSKTTPLLLYCIQSLTKSIFVTHSTLFRFHISLDCSCSTLILQCFSVKHQFINTSNRHSTIITKEEYLLERLINCKNVLYWVMGIPFVKEQKFWERTKFLERNDERYFFYWRIDFFEEKNYLKELFYWANDFTERLFIDKTNEIDVKMWNNFDYAWKKNFKWFKKMTKWAVQ